MIFVEQIYSIELFDGWNFIGLPVLPNDKSVENVFSSILESVNSIWTYSGETDSWSSFSPGAPSNLVSVDYDFGYWVKVNGDITLRLMGEGVSFSLP